MFQTPLAITGTEAQFNAFLPKLEALGYQKATFGFLSYHPSPSASLLVTNLGGHNGKYSFTYYENKDKYNRTQVDAANEPLVLALAAMREGSTFYPGEAVMLNEWKNGKRIESLYIIKSIDSDGNSYPINLVSGGAWAADKNIRKATKEEIIAKYTKQQPPMPLNKLYTHDHDVTYEMVTTHPYFRTLAEHELYHVIDWMNENGYKRLSGNNPREKAQLLQESWKAPVYNSYAVYANTYEEAEALTAYQDKLFGGCEPARRYTYYRFSLRKDYIGSRYGRANNRDVYGPGRPAEVEHIFDSFQDWKAYIARVEGKEIPGRKLVGYKSPTALFNGKVPAGTLFTEAVEEGMYNSHVGPYQLPKEIVETWEAVYEEEKTILEIGTPKKTITITPGKIEVEGKAVDCGKLVDLYREMTHAADIADWKVTYEQVRIGCSRFTAQEIFQVLTAYTTISK